MPALPSRLNLLHPPFLPDSTLFFALFPSTLFTFCLVNLDSACDGQWLYLFLVWFGYVMPLLAFAVVYLCVTGMTNTIMYRILDCIMDYFPSLPVVVSASPLNLCMWPPRPFRRCQKGEDKYDHVLIKSADLS